jgi:Tfp pilus assembly protein PilV
MRARPVRGFSVIEALVGVALAGLAMAGLAGVAGLATRSLCLARDAGVALALASERLEALRAGPRADGADTRVAADGTVFARRWQVAGGRGAPLRLSVRVTWGTHAQVLATEVPP